MLTSKRLEELNYTKKEKQGRLYFQKGNVLLSHVDTDGWEFSANNGIEMSDGIIFTTEEELNTLLNNH